MEQTEARDLNAARSKEDTRVRKVESTFQQATTLNFCQYEHVNNFILK